MRFNELRGSRKEGNLIKEARRQHERMYMSHLLETEKISRDESSKMKKLMEEYDKPLAKEVNKDLFKEYDKPLF